MKKSRRSLHRCRPSLVLVLLEPQVPEVLPLRELLTILRSFHQLMKAILLRSTSRIRRKRP